MEIIKKLIKNKGISDIFLIVSLICAIVALPCYINSGITEFKATLDSKVINSMIFLIVIDGCLLVVSSKIVKYIEAALYIFTLISYISTQATYLANVLVAIDGTSLSGGFIACMVCLVLGFIASLLSGIFAKDEFELIKESKETKNENI